MAESEKKGCQKSYSDRFLTVIEYVFALSIILTGGSMYGVMVTFRERGFDAFSLRVIAMGCAVLLILAYFIKNKKIEFRKQSIAGFIAFALMVGHLLLTGYNQKAGLENLILPFFLFLVMMHVNAPNQTFKNFFHAYSNIILVIAVISLVFYLFGPLLQVIPGQFFEFYNYGKANLGYNYFYVFFLNFGQYKDIAGISFCRNVAIFMESPDFATPLLITLFWKLFYGKKARKFQIIVLCITLISTMSSKAYLFGAAILAGYFLFVYCNRSEKLQNIKKRILPILIGVGVVAVVAMLVIKATSTLGSESFSIRMDDILAAIKTWFAHPILGAGFYNLEEFYSNYQWTLKGGDPTAGILNILAFGGIYMFAVYAYGYANFVRKLETQKEVKWGFFILFLAIMCISAMQYNYLTVFLLAIGWML